MATNYYKSLFDNGYKTPKPAQTAAVPAPKVYTAPKVAKNTITQPATLKTGLAKQANLTEAGNIYEKNVTDVLTGAKKAPGLEQYQNQVNRANAFSNTNATNSAKSQAAAAGLTPGTAAYQRLLSSNQSQAAGQNLDRQNQVNQLANSTYADFLNKGSQVENDAYGRANAERNYGTERDDVLYGRNLNERDYGDSRDDKQNALDRDALEFNTTQDLNQFNMANTLDRQNRQDYENERGFEYGAAKDEDATGYRDSQAEEDKRRYELGRGDTLSQQDTLNQQWEKTFGASREDKASDDQFRGAEFDEDKYRYSTDRGDQLTRDSVKDNQWNLQFGATREDKASDDAFRNQEFDASREDKASDNQYRDKVFNTQTGQWEQEFANEKDQFNTTRTDTLSQQEKENAQWEKQFGASREDQKNEEQYRDMVFNTQTGQWEKEFEAGRTDKASDDAFRDKEFDTGVDQFNTTRTDNLSQNELEAAQWEKQFGASREDRASDDEFRDMEFNTTTGQWEKAFNADQEQLGLDNKFRDSQASEDTRQFDATLDNTKSQQDIDNEQWNKTFGADQDQRGIDNTYRDKAFDEESSQFDLTRGDNLAQNATLNDQWSQAFNEDTRQYDTNRTDTMARNEIEDNRYNQEYADTRQDLAYEHSQSEYSDLLNSLGSEAAKQAMQQAKINGGDYKTAYTNLFDESGKLKSENMDISPDQAKMQSRIDEMKQIYPEKSEEEIKQIVSNDMKADYESERAGIQETQDKAAQERRIANISDPKTFNSMPVSDLSAIAGNPDLVNKYKVDGLIKPVAEFDRTLRVSDLASKGIEEGSVVQMKDGSIVKLTYINSDKSSGNFSTFRQMVVKGTDARTGKEVTVYDSGRQQI